MTISIDAWMGRSEFLLSLLKVDIVVFLTYNMKCFFYEIHCTGCVQNENYFVV